MEPLSTLGLRHRARGEQGLTDTGDASDAAPPEAAPPLRWWWLLLVLSAAALATALS